MIASRNTTALDRAVSSGGCELAGSAGDEQCSHGLLGCLVAEDEPGSLVEFAGDSPRSRAVWTERSVCFGKYWRSSPLVFSLRPRCQGECGSQKYTSKPVAAAVCSCIVISRPWSQVRVLRHPGGMTGLGDERVAQLWGLVPVGQVHEDQERLVTVSTRVPMAPVPEQTRSCR